MAGFTRAQHGKYRPVVERAWKKHARENDLPEDGKESRPHREKWYKAELLKSVGVNSTQPLDKGRDFDAAIAHFEALADDAGTYWQQRCNDGDLRRIRHTVGDQTITAEYCSGIAKQMLSLDHLPELRCLKKSTLKAIVMRLKIHAARS